MRKLMLFALLAGLMLVPSMVQAMAAQKPVALGDVDKVKQVSVIKWIGDWQTYLVVEIGKKKTEIDNANKGEIKAVYDALAASYAAIEAEIKKEAAAGAAK